MAKAATTSMTKASPAAQRKAAGAKKEPQPRSDNPMDWLFDNPLGSYPDFVFGILKQSYGGHRNNVLEFATRKLRPVEGRGGDGKPDPEAITAHRFGAVLPEDAPDVFDDIFELLPAIQEAALPHEPALLIYVTLSFSETRRLHTGWEEARAFALEAFAHARQLPVALVQHAPGRVGSNNPPHVHLLVSPRRLTGMDFAGYAVDISCDEGQKLIYDEWLAFRRKWCG